MRTRRPTPGTHARPDTYSRMHPSPRRALEHGEARLAHAAEVLARGHLAHGIHERRFLTRAKRQREGYIRPVLRSTVMRTGAFREVTYAIVHGIGNRQLNDGHECLLHEKPCLARCLDRALRRRRVRADKPAGAQECAAKVARHHATAIPEARTAKDLERRHTARALGLPVVTLALRTIRRIQAGTLWRAS